MASRKRNNIAFRLTIFLLVILSAVTLIVNYFNLPDHQSDVAVKNSNRQVLLDLTVKIENELRRRRIRRICPFIYDVPKKPNWIQFMHERASRSRDYKWWQHLYVNEQQKLLYCSIPHVTTTSLFRSYFHHQESNSSKQVVLKNLAEFKVTDAMTIIETYRKMIWVRNPLDRLISAWKSKFATTTPTNDPYYSNVAGSQIIKLYRPNATADAIKRGFPVELHEFFRFLAAQHHPQFFDVHWRPYLDLCLVCAIDYDYIGKLEEIDVEFGVFMRNSTRSKLLLRTYDHSSEKEQRVNVASDGRLSRDLLNRVLLIYKLDFDLFGYNIADDMKL